MLTDCSTTASRTSPQNRTVALANTGIWGEDTLTDTAMPKYNYQRMEEIFLVGNKCQTRSCLRVILPPPSPAGERLPLKTSFSVDAIRQNSEHLADKQTYRAYNIVDYSDQMRDIRMGAIRKQRQKNQQNVEKAGEASRFGKLHEVRKRLIKQ